jgi:hypothetical protein
MNQLIKVFLTPGGVAVALGLSACSLRVAFDPTETAIGDAGVITQDAGEDNSDADRAPCQLPGSYGGTEVGAASGTADPLGYAAFAVDGCELYRINRAGELVRQGAGGETQLAPASESPRRPSAKAGLVTWEFGALAAPSVAVFDVQSGQRVTLSGGFHHAGEPRSTGTAVVFTGWKAAGEDGDSDVFAYRRASRTLETIFGGSGQQRFADGEGETFAASDFSEDPSGVFAFGAYHDSDIVVWSENRASRRASKGKQAFPLVTKDKQVVYLDWNNIHPEPKLRAYAIKKGDLLGAPAADTLVESVGISATTYFRPAIFGQGVLFLNQDDLRLALPGALPRTLATGRFLAMQATPDRRVLVSERTAGGAALRDLSP